MQFTIVIHWTYISSQAESSCLCPMCQNGVQSEFHVLVDCDFYSGITLMEISQALDLRFTYMCSFDKCCF